MFKILIIEDDIIDQLALTRLINKNNLDCELTLSMKIYEAIQLLETNSFDLVICDLNLPDGKAFDLKQLIKKQPFILLSGHIDPDIVRKATEFGSIKILQKSSDLSQLTYISNLIKTMLNQQSAHESAALISDYPVESTFNIKQLMKTFDQKVELVIEIIELFIQGNPQLIANILSAIQTENRPSAKLMLHRLKSNCTMIGLKEQHDIAERIEQLALHETSVVLESEMATLKLSLDSILPVLKAAVSKLKNT